jgi:3-oxoacyl-[acyl-carrier protein] reductase
MFLIDINAGAEVIARAIRQTGGAATAETADVSQRAEVERIANQVGAIDGLVLNTAICPWDEDLNGLDWDASFERVTKVNVLGPIHAARAFMPGTIARSKGAIVLAGSLAGRMGGLTPDPTTSGPRAPCMRSSNGSRVKPRHMAF